MGGHTRRERKSAGKMGSPPFAALLNITSLTDRMMTSYKHRAFGPIAILICFFLALLAVPATKGTLNSVPEPGVSDGIEYDSLAWQLAQGHGFAFDFDDPSFKKPYEEVGAPHGSGRGETTYRPPMLPAVMALFYKAFGRTFAPIRIFNCLVVAMAAMSTFVMVRKRLGLTAAIATTAFLAIDGRTWFFSNKILTEALACFTTVLIVWSLLKFQEEWTNKWAVAVGISLALGFFTRSILIFWFPILAVIIPYLHQEKFSLTPVKQGVKSALVFVVTFMVLTTPWFIRNCVVMGKFAPLGTMGAMSMAAAYSDKALAEKGRWYDLAATGFFPVAPSDRYDTLTKEKRNAAYSQSAALHWIKANPTKLPALALYKVWDLWLPDTPRQTLLFTFFLLGCFLYPVKKHLVIFGAILVANTLGVAVTWSVGNRFLFPVLPVIAILAAGGLCEVYRIYQSYREQPVDSRFE
ncbi:ArnT family glycosyltransferase [Geomonas propionica]|uniref:Glycosyltransferase family 39 protein n=1 Tax=Geomonas propionica TaxID=2798582 RepID=A0ABS0YPS7_9BACT|nr:glycosyltransferase family 39 protein [Geomonas propionica]MBJ6799929.1 glycosyltransferase family 39 protein [Geomonas propionica]